MSEIKDFMHRVEDERDREKKEIKEIEVELKYAELKAEMLKEISSGLYGEEASRNKYVEIQRKTSIEDIDRLKKSLEEKILNRNVLEYQVRYLTEKIVSESQH